MHPPRQALPLATGFAALDGALGIGGLPRGAIVELFGPTCGKSTLALQIVAHAQRGNFAAAWLDADRTFDPAWAATLGVSVERLPLLRPASAEQALEIAVRLAGSHALDLLVVDSAAALAPQAELAAALGDASPGLLSRVLATGLRKLSLAAARSELVVLFLNQPRTRPEPSQHEPDTSAGGAPLKLFASVRIAMAPAGGLRAGLHVLKNKAAGGAPRCELVWERGHGFVNTP
jgi:recombination protein RecA